MSKDYRYQQEDEWDSVESEGGGKRNRSRRQQDIKSKQKRDMQRRDKQRRMHQESY